MEKSNGHRNKIHYLIEFFHLTLDQYICLETLVEFLSQRSNFLVLVTKIIKAKYTAYNSSYN